MKKIVLASVLVAGVLFAADFQNSTPEQINASIAGADAKSLSEAAFEIDKRAGELRAQARDLKRGFKTEFKKKLDAMSVEDREKFLDEFRKNYNAQAGKLSVEQADRLDIELKDRGNFGKFKRPAHGFGPHRSRWHPASAPICCLKEWAEARGEQCRRETRCRVIKTRVPLCAL
ncbi:DUF1104 domain-containing protein [uncultured Campylobacter sp.]|uniref:DUF1104 domain-containing protein n=1 Tax=uncultured Campylobacter sp. TaxID=218934 RepID=UPI0026234861|nr:DUF1104 domain-containing protein [uncultured Campylobacter sp.]